MKIRLMGTEAECREAAERIAGVVDVLEVSSPRANRDGSRLVRVYLEARIEPPLRVASTSQPVSRRRRELPPGGAR